VAVDVRDIRGKVMAGVSLKLGRFLYPRLCVFVSYYQNWVVEGVIHCEEGDESWSLVGQFLVCISLSGAG